MKAAAMPVLLQLSAATVRVGARTFGPFDLALRAGERVAILGPSGAGKSTLLRRIAGELGGAGEVQLDGRPLAAWSPAERSRRRAVLPQQHGVAFGLPARLVVELGRIACLHDPERTATVDAALALAEAGALAERRFDTLSGGEQARVQLARVFAQLWDVRGGLLLVDEPLSALDPALQLDAMAALQAFAVERGHALVAVLHDLGQALAGFDRLWLVRGGALQADVPADLKALPALERLYGVSLRALDDGDGGHALRVRRAAGASSNSLSETRP